MIYIYTCFVAREKGNKWSSLILLGDAMFAIIGDQDRGDWQPALSCNEGIKLFASKVGVVDWHTAVTVQNLCYKWVAVNVSLEYIGRMRLVRSVIVIAIIPDRETITHNLLIDLLFI